MRRCFDCGWRFCIGRRFGWSAGLCRRSDGSRARINCKICIRIIRHGSYARLISDHLNSKLRPGRIADKHRPIIKTNIWNIGNDPIQAAIATFISNGYPVNIGRGLPLDSVDTADRQHLAAIWGGNGDPACWRSKFSLRSRD